MWFTAILKELTKISLAYELAVGEVNSIVFDVAYSDVWVA
jgi:hypothetical protein